MLNLEYSTLFFCRQVEIVQYTRYNAQYMQNIGKKTLLSRRNRKIATIELLADYFHVHRNTMRKALQEYNVDLYDLYSIISFVRKYRKDIDN